MSGFSVFDENVYISTCRRKNVNGKSANIDRQRVTKTNDDLTKIILATIYRDVVEAVVFRRKTYDGERFVPDTRLRTDISYF